jgi:uncharacterized protein (DUF885 family)
MELCDQYLDELLVIDPTLNDFLSNSSYRKDIQPNIYSESYYHKLHKLNKKYLQKIEKKSNKTRYDKLLMNDLQHSIMMEEKYEIYMYIPIDVFDNKLIDYISECSGNGFYQFKQPSDYTDFMKRMKTLTPITDEIIKKMKQGIKNNVTLYTKIVDEMIHQLQTSIKTNSYYQKVPHQKQWDKCVDKYLVSNLQRLLSFLINEYYVHCSTKCGLHSYKQGKDYYRKTIHYEISKECSPENIHQFGQQELILLQKELNKLHIHEPKSPYKHKREIIRDLKKIQKDIKQVNKHLFDKEVKDYKIKSISPEKKHMVAYYEKSTPQRNYGTFYINTFDVKKWNPFELVVLSLHEGYPGHHYEIEYHKDKHQPKYMDLWLNDAYSEGWAFYSEHMYPYKKDEFYYYKIQYDILRTLRLIIDTGIHYYKWDYETCFQFMKDNSSMEESRIHKELIRYLCMPGQALSYKVGGTIISKLRKLCLEKGYTVKEFHKLILSLGPCPMDELIHSAMDLLKN